MADEESKAIEAKDGEELPLTSNPYLHTMKEAVVKYDVFGGDPSLSTISSKNQITLPAHLLREIGLGSGDRLAISREGSRLILRARPRDWVSYHGGSLRGLYGKDEREIDAYIDELRGDTSRDEELERAWSGREPAP